ncbi:lipopolysaccharide heptosyltransferase II [uncultured Ilyobacter sp.]|uniref:lipopolysaccharide heptosyltransferase II n=1 Tax=uncultured Ilyobacter sp. TaxID=544433 RepID=UPI0029C031E9|nr:lipopolysaccharide heptosyltransferase II [uncultured Ilyobacter sp.]
MKILIIHTAFIGDIVLSTPLIKKLKEKYPDSSITYVTTPVGSAILRNNPNLSEIIEYDKRGEHKGLKGLFLLGKRLKYKNFDMIITPHRYLRSSLLTWLTGAPVRVGYDNSAGKLFFTKKVHYDETKHEVEKLLSFVDDKNNKYYGIELFPGKAEKIRVDEIWSENHLKNKKIVAIAPGSKWFTKQWPLEYFNDLIENLSKRENTAIVLIGGREELLLNVKETDKTVNLIGKTSLLEVAEVTRRSHVVLTNDSSPIHIASAWKDTHIIAIFGATVRELGFYPWSKNSQIIENTGLPCRPCGLHGGKKCPKGHFKCMLDLKPDMVLEKIEEKLDKITI